jgi:hypothetical protein
MKYLCLVYVDEAVVDGMPEQVFDALSDAALASDDALRRSGHYVASNALQSVRAATSVRARDGRLAVTDGPFAETREHLGGYVLIEAADLAEAIELAAKIPMARLGTIEVRPVRELMRRENRRWL